MVDWQKVAKFTKRNIVLVVMVPVMVSLHVGWSLLQNVEHFVSKQEKRELPLLSVSLMKCSIDIHHTF